MYQEGRAIEGAVSAIEALRRAGIPFRFATNTTRMPRTALAERLISLGIQASPEEILSAPAAAARWLRSRGVERVRLLLARETWGEFEGMEVDDRAPQYVVVGDLAEGWTFEVLNGAFRNLMDGAELLAIQRNRSWHTDGRSEPGRRSLRRSPGVRLRQDRHSRRQAEPRLFRGRRPRVGTASRPHRRHWRRS